ncbi:MAG TPA: sulfur carrier protein ThiS [Phycisphaerales bacterium]|nr:sulfur carrier protein ThiS [Phycisphaerales bacterium]
MSSSWVQRNAQNLGASCSATQLASHLKTPPALYSCTTDCYNSPVIKVNGNEIECEESMRLEVLLEKLGFSDQTCAVEVNKELIPHDKRESQVLICGDTVEIVSLVGGG